MMLSKDALSLYEHQTVVTIIAKDNKEKCTSKGPMINKTRTPKHQTVSEYNLKPEISPYDQYKLG